jgi:DNA (cytosine-5)-methyltransferase 1
VWIVSKFPYIWNLKDTTFTKDKGKVFSCFACGGGSSMGYKLAGFDVIGVNEIDPKMMDAYKTNHNPKYAFLEPIQTFKLRNDLPQDLFNLDILDGSPPCSSFSMAGDREEKWGVEKKFREGQQEQILDTLFFDFIDLAKKLQPKVVVAENVKGLLLGNAKSYVLKIYEEFEKAGYYVKHWLLDSSRMGVPRRRERVFFLAIRKDLAAPFLEQLDMFLVTPRINLDFNEPPIYFKEFYQPGISDRVCSTGKMFDYWSKRQKSDKSFCDILMREYDRNSCFNNLLLHPDEIPNTFTSNSDCFYLYDEYRKPNKYESCCIGSFPQDYNFTNNQYSYIIGMSVPPIMVAQIATRIYDTWLKNM